MLNYIKQGVYKIFKERAIKKPYIFELDSTQQWKFEERLKKSFEKTKESIKILKLAGKFLSNFNSTQKNVYASKNTNLELYSPSKDKNSKFPNKNKKLVSQNTDPGNNPSNSFSKSIYEPSKDFVNLVEKEIISKNTVSSNVKSNNDISYWNTNITETSKLNSLLESNISCAVSTDIKFLDYNKFENLENENKWNEIYNTTNELIQKFDKEKNDQQNSIITKANSNIESELEQNLRLIFYKSLWIKSQIIIKKIPVLLLNGFIDSLNEDFTLIKEKLDNFNSNLSKTGERNGESKVSDEFLRKVLSKCNSNIIYCIKYKIQNSQKLLDAPAQIIFDPVIFDPEKSFTKSTSLNFELENNNKKNKEVKKKH